MGAVALIFVMGLLTFYGDRTDRAYFYRQALFGAVGLVLMISVSFANWRIFRASSLAVVSLYVLGVVLLFVLFVVGSQVRGVVSWFKIGGLSIEPAEPMKVFLVFLLARYFSSRYIEVYKWKNIIVSGLYAAVPVILILVQPDFGSALILASIWLGMVLVSGIKVKQILWIFVLFVVCLGALWSYGLKDYQRDRVMSFLDPGRDPLGGSYQSRQAIVAIGSGGWLGKGIGQGTQARLGFLPEYHTDFIFAAIAEEWGFLGTLILLAGWFLIFLRLYKNLLFAPDNFSRLFIVGVMIILGAHFAINIGANLGFLPITGIPLAFVSYGGSNLLSLCLAVGLVQSIKGRVLRQEFDPDKVLWQE